MPIRRLELGVRVLIEAENHLRPLDQNRPADEIRIGQHEVNRLLLRLRERPFFPDWTAHAHVIEETSGIHVSFEPFARRGLFVDVDFRDVDIRGRQKTSGVLAGRSGRLAVEHWLGHTSRIVNCAHGE